MKLLKIIIDNFKSITNLELDVSFPVIGSFCYGLLGINESGKTNILQAISFKDLHSKMDLSKVISKYSIDSMKITYCYELSHEEQKEFREKIAADERIINFDQIQEINPIAFDLILFRKPDGKVDRKIIFNYNQNLNERFIHLKKPQNALAMLKEPNLADIKISAKEYFQDNFENWAIELTHEIIMWKPDSRTMFSDSIDIDKFLQDPRKASLPLYNCFFLYDQNWQEQQIKSICQDPAQRSELEKALSTKTTEHINRIWPQHKVSVEFSITENKISLVIPEITGKYTRIDDRSDGFKQFISFLLCVSIGNKHNQFSNKILLIDEPEIHLHPTAQEEFLREIINIAKENNNIVFYTTHSIFMIDKFSVGRHYHIVKSENNKGTSIGKFDCTTLSFSKIIYKVFEIPNTDYHNELYGNIQFKSGHELIDQMEVFLKSKHVKEHKSYLRKQNGQLKKPVMLTLPTYIRNISHHPENTSNEKFCERELKELKESIDIMEEILADL